MPPLAVPSSLVSTMPVTSTASANCFACTRPFCPVDASITSSTSLQRTLGAVDDPAQLLQLLHEVRLRVQPARGVDEHEIGAAARLRPPSRRTRPNPGRRPLAPRTISPPVRSAQSCELIGGRGAERVGRGEHDALRRRRPAAARACRSSSSCRRRSRRRTSRRSVRRRRACSVAIGSSREQRASTSSLQQIR